MNKELANRIINIIDQTKNGQMKWKRVNPTTFLWEKDITSNEQTNNDIKRGIKARTIIQIFVQRIDKMENFTTSYSFEMRDKMRDEVVLDYNAPFNDEDSKTLKMLYNEIEKAFLQNGLDLLDKAIFGQ